MKKQLLFLCFVCIAFFVKAQTITVNPASFNEDEEITITVSDFDPVASWGVSDLYLWAWHFDSNGNQINNPTATGTDFSNSPETAKFTNNGNGTYSYSFTPTTFYNNTGISRIGFLVKSQDGTNQTQDYLYDVGRVIITLNEPSSLPAVVFSGGSLFVSATIAAQGSTTVQGTFEIFYNDVMVVSGSCGFPACSATIDNITENGTVRFVGTPPSSTETGEITFEAIIIPDVVEETIPAGLEEGINYDSSDPTRATLVLNAPNKTFVQVAGSFNNYDPDATYAMKKDPTSDKFWLEITGLTSNQIYTYQYWVYAENPVAGSPTLVKAADPYSTLVLSPFDDPFIPANSYPNIPAYPAGQEREVTVLQTGQTPYDWQVDNFVKPKKEDLIVYEVLIRDFDENRNYQDLIDRIDYFKNLQVNAIQLMPVMEYEGNESWGYNTSFHMALDKYYGTSDKFKEFVDLCHQNGIAVILDLAINHAFGRNPLVRMWMDDPDNNGWGEPSSENPYFNQVPLHSYNVGSDFNHSSSLTQEYTKRVVKHWVEEYRIDGIRWDLTKGFTQNCTASDETCTNGYQQDRIDVLKDYADYSWSLDEDHYVIFEHLGSENEEKEWANYKYGEGKGIMMWGKMTDPYNQLTMGYASNSNIDGMGHKSRSQFQGPRVMGYAESHDEERLMYKNVQFGNSTNSSHNVTDLNTALSRMSALGAISTMIPGPKMIWHFSSLGMENSIFTCNNGSVNDPGGTDGDCKLDTKPQPQWVNNWLADPNRNQIYNDWTILHQLKIEEPVFEGDYNLTSGDLNPRLHVFDNNLPASSLKDVVIITNFDVTDKDVDPDFPYTGTWYDLMDLSGGTNINVTDVNATISIPAGQFRIFGNEAATLSVTNPELQDVQLYPNPSTTFFQISTQVQELEIYDISGKMIKSFKGSFDPSHTYDISTLSTGIYLVKFINIDNVPFLKKIIVQD